MLNELRKSHGLHVNERKHLESGLISLVVSSPDALLCGELRRQLFLREEAHNKSHHNRAYSMDQVLH